jgi:hypothetical protein
VGVRDAKDDGVDDAPEVRGSIRLAFTSGGGESGSSNRSVGSNRVAPSRVSDTITASGCLFHRPRPSDTQRRVAKPGETRAIARLHMLAALQPEGTGSHELRVATLAQLGVLLDVNLLTPSPMCLAT